MSDFIRLNLNSAIGMASLLVILIAGYIIIYRNKSLEEEYKKYLKRAFYGILALILFFTIFSLMTQLSVNVLPKQEIDRSFTLETQKNYQQTLKEREKSYEDSLKAEKDTL